MILAADGLVVTGAIVVVVLFAALILVGAGTRGTNDGFLEWNPAERSSFKAGQEDADLEEMLGLHNAQRARDGLPAVTLDEYVESVRKRPH